MARELLGELGEKADEVPELIPIAGSASSLNAASATTVLL